MNVQNKISVLKFSKIRKKWFINVSEDPDMRNATLDIERSLKKNFTLTLVCSL